MNNVVGHFIILAGAGIGACALSLAFGWPNQTTSPDEPAVVVVLPQRAGEPARAPVAEPPRPVPTPGDRVALIRELQRELKRVGCYEGEISGAWTPSTRMAMKGFTDRVNARLPIDQPDFILLKLVQNQNDKVCGKPCPTGLATAQDGRCVSEAMLANPPKPEPATRPEPIVAKTSSPPAEARPERVPAASPELPRMASVTPNPDAPAPTAESPRSSPRADVPVPPDGVYERRPRHRAQSKPPKIVRSLIRNVQRTLAPLGLPF